ncbi:MAG: hypothetical protein GEU74_12370 [Nitriliruptorales bacterium]|nr:hypothetical protein [Nitriliruptorales bacterium]
MSEPNTVADEVRFFLDWCHMPPEWIAHTLGYADAENLRVTLRRHSHSDLADRLTKTEAA